MSTPEERQAAYVAHDHNVAWNALWDRCEKAEAEVARLRAAITEARTWLLLPANVDLNGSDRIYRIVDDALDDRQQRPTVDDVPSCGSENDYGVATRARQQRKEQGK